MGTAGAPSAGVERGGVAFSYTGASEADCAAFGDGEAIIGDATAATFLAIVVGLGKEISVGYVQSLAVMTRRRKTIRRRIGRSPILSHKACTREV